MTPRCHSIEGVRKFLRVSRRKVELWIRTGQLKAIDVGVERPQYRITEAALQEFIEARTTGAPPVLRRKIEQII